MNPELLRREQRRDPSSHYEKNVRRYSYNGQPLNIERSLTKLGHVKSEIKVVPWDLQKSRDSQMYHISELSNLKR
jgi:hypothetical protein